MSERRVPVQGERHLGIPAGTIDWSEHLQAWDQYHKTFWSQDAETIAARGGFGYSELRLFLGRDPETWKPRA